MHRFQKVIFFALLRSANEDRWLQRSSDAPNDFVTPLSVKSPFLNENPESARVWSGLKYYITENPVDI